MIGLSTSLSALRAAQTSLDVVAQNIANANTPGYHRQVAILADKTPVQVQRLLVGTGVEVANIMRMRDAVVERALTSNISALEASSRRVDVLRQVESLLTPGEGSVHSRLQSFFNQLDQLASRPDDSAQRAILLQTAVGLTEEIRRLSDGFSAIQSGLDVEITDTVKQINRLTRDISALNRDITVKEHEGISANDIRDRRDELINELAKYVSVDFNDAEGGILIGDGSVFIGQTAVELAVVQDANGFPAISVQGFDGTLSFSSGSLSAALNLRSEVVPTFTKELETFTQKMIQTIDVAHATGLGLTGSFSTLAGQRSVTDVNAPLANALKGFPVKNGTLYVSVTNKTTGERTLNAINVDPSTQSLNDIVAAINGIDHVQAVINPQTRALTIISESGYQFDFAGRLETSPDPASITGTTRPGLKGTYTGTKNDDWTFNVVGSGTVGVTSGLSVEVRDGSGELITTVNVGSGYEPGSAINIAEGVQLTLSSGTFNAGDAFSTSVVATPDSSQIAAALGLNTFFLGAGSADVRVNPALLQNPNLLATTKTGLPGDTANLNALRNLREQRVLGNADSTLEQALARITSRAGALVQDVQEVQENLQLMDQRLQVDREQLSGVDPNEELVMMLQYQRAFQAAARHLQAASETLSELMKIIG